MSEKPAVVILGGCGFIGRNLVEYLIENDLVSKLRIIDKVCPELAWLSPKHKKIFENPKIEFISGNLIHPTTCELIFINNNNEDITWEYVFNCAGETRPGLDKEIYEEGIYKLSLNCATASARYGILKYIELSSGEISKNSKTPMLETDSLEPWSIIAKCKSKVEKALGDIPGLNYTIIRPAIVYGNADRNVIVQRMILASIYKHLNETLQLFGTKDLPMNTIYVSDLCRCIWHTAHVLPHPKSYKQVFNASDTGCTTQDSIMSVICDIFNVQYDCVPKLLSTICELDLDSVIEEINDKHMDPWNQLCQKYSIDNTPLNPYVVKDMLVSKPVHLDNSKLLKTGFVFETPIFSRDKVREVLDEYIQMGLFPGELITKL